MNRLWSVVFRTIGNAVRTALLLALALMLLSCNEVKLNDERSIYSVQGVNTELFLEHNLIALEAYDGVTYELISRKSDSLTRILLKDQFELLNQGNEYILKIEKFNKNPNLELTIKIRSHNAGILANDSVGSPWFWYDDSVWVDLYYSDDIVDVYVRK